MKLIERMAREICKTQSGGLFDPDTMVLDGYKPLVGPKNSIVLDDTMFDRRIELWRLFIPEAEAALSVINKAQLSAD